ncbi:hypothetical protein [Romboutsia sp.]|uniref:hypothetical protein n=1 Tax=Romboutsia sp. TaxID=1965302 RepID=UPI002C3CDB0D|nr:hypothetical protein [Romboutsia sp.]HSQ87979.1 hypothetical protein [Romboutsia sp.]
MLKYYYGTMASGKSATLLMNAHQKKKNNIKCLIIKPHDKRDDKVTSRIGLESDCIVFYPEDDLFEMFKLKRLSEGITEIYVDECQFLTKEQIHQLWLLSRGDVTVNCFGLRVTYRNELFTAIQTLSVYADVEVKLEPTCTCKYCNEDATTHLLIVDDKAVLDYPEKFEGDVEGDIHFECVCIGCWLERIAKDTQ